MAFNPLHNIRKHQKKFLAAVTILCMVIFVLQFSSTSGGDFFSEITRAIGGGGPKGKVVARLYGSPVVEPQVDQLQRQRQIANMYIVAAVEIGQANVVRKVEAELLPQLKADERTQNEIKGILSFWQAVHNPSPQFAQFRSQLVQMYIRDRAQYQSTLLRVHSEMVRAEKPKEAELVQQLMDVIEQDGSLMTRLSGGLFFGGTSLTDLKELLDFKIWLHEADALGVQLAREDVKQLVNNEARGQLTQDSFRELDRIVRRQFPNASAEQIVGSLTDEFRVRLAKATLLGFEARPDAPVPAPVTPYEFWQFFRNQRTESLVALLPIPVDHKDFLAKVPDPKDEQLRAYFEQHKNREHAPDATAPGFKQPARTEVEWVSVRADAPHFREEAKKAAAAARAAQQVGASLMPLEVGTVAPAVTAALPLTFDLPLIARYEYDKYMYRNPGWNEPWDPDRPENVASLFGQVTAAVGNLTTPLSVPLSQHGARVAHGLEKFRAWSEMALAGALPAPFTTAGLAYVAIPRNEFQPLAAVREQVGERNAEALARDLAKKHLDTVREELERLSRLRGDEVRKADNAAQPAAVASAVGDALAAGLGGSPLAAPLTYTSRVLSHDLKEYGRLAGETFLQAVGSPLLAAAHVYQEQNLGQVKARAYLKDAIAKYHLEHGTTSKPRDRFDIDEDPGLKALRESYTRSPHQKAKDFEKLFFPHRGAYVPQRWPQNASMPLTGENAQAFLYWNTSDLPPYTPAFEDVKERVKRRWKMERARDLAKKEAERVAAEASKVKGDADRVLKDGSPHAGKLVYLDRVTRLTKGPSLTAFENFQTQAGGYRPYKLPEDRVEYPTGDFLEKLLSLKEPGEVVVLQNRPESVYYVAALVHCAPPDEKAFYDDLARDYNDLLFQMEQEKHVRERYREGIAKRLRDEANLQVVDADYQKRLEQQRGPDDE